MAPKDLEHYVFFLLAPVGGLVVCLPSTLAVGLAWTASTLLATPAGTVSAYRGLWMTPRLGPWAKAVLAVLLVLSILLALPLSLLAGTIAGFCVGFVDGCMKFYCLLSGEGEMGWNEKDFDGGSKVYFIAWHFIRRFHMHSGRLPEWCNHYATQKLPEGGQPFELSPLSAVVSLLCGVLGGAVCGVCFLLASLLYALQTIFHLYRHATNLVLSHPLLIVFYLFFLVLLPVFYALFILINLPVGLLFGLVKCVGACYTTAVRTAVGGGLERCQTADSQGPEWEGSKPVFAGFANDVDRSIKDGGFAKSGGLDWLGGGFRAAAICARGVVMWRFEKGAELLGKLRKY